MKKTIIAASAVLLVAASSFAQGYITFNSGSKYAYDNFTVAGTAAKNANVNVGLIWVAGSGQTLAALGSSGSVSAVNIASPWSSLAALPTGWAWGSIDGTSVYKTPTIGTAGPAQGSFSGGSQPMSGGSVGELVTVYAVAWNAAYADPMSAAAAGSAVGWSNPFNYTFGSSGVPGAAVSGLITSPFYVNTVAPVPEPATMALAALGGASLLLFRRRK